MGSSPADRNESRAQPDLELQCELLDVGLNLPGLCASELFLCSPPQICANWFAEVHLQQLLNPTAKHCKQIHK